MRLRAVVCAASAAHHGRAVAFGATPVGAITLCKMEGAPVKDVGRVAFSRDSVCVRYNGTCILLGGSFL